MFCLSLSLPPSHTHTLSLSLHTISNAKQIHTQTLFFWHSHSLSNTHTHARTRIFCIHLSPKILITRARTKMNTFILSKMCVNTGEDCINKLLLIVHNTAWILSADIFCILHKQEKINKLMTTYHHHFSFWMNWQFAFAFIGK